MLNLFYNYEKSAQAPPGGGVAVVPKFAHADYIEALLTVYSSGTTPMDLSGVASWRGALDVDSDATTEPLVRLQPDVFDATDAAGGKLAFPVDCNTVNFRDGVSASATGFLEIYGHDADDRQIVRIRIASTLLPAIDPPGDPSPLDVPPSSVRTLNGISGAVVLKDSAGAALTPSGQTIQLSKAAVGLGNVANLLDNLTATSAPTVTDDSTKGYSKKSQWIYAGKFYTCVDPTVGAAVWTEGGGGAGDVTAAGDNVFSGNNTFDNPLTVGGRTVSGLYPDRNPVAQVPVLDATLGVCHILDATLTEISFAYPVWHLVEIRALVRSVNAAITGTVEITPYIDDVAQTPVTINVSATWALVTIPLVVETGAVRLVRTGGTLADGSWVGAALRSITAMVTI